MVSFHTLADSPTQRPTPKAFPFNHFHTFSIATEGVPPSPVPISNFDFPISAFSRFSRFQFPISCFQFPPLRNSLKVRGVDFHRRRPRNQVQRQHHPTGVLLPDKLPFHPRQRPALDAYPGSNA